MKDRKDAIFLINYVDDFSYFSIGFQSYALMCLSLADNNLLKDLSTSYVILTISSLNHQKKTTNNAFC